jgi:uncharacterized membrane protein YphA (DoxX/SURF4 family)
MSAVLLIARLMLAAVFAIASIAKLADVQATRRSLGDFGLAERFVGIGAHALSLAELAVAILLFPRPTARWGALGAFLLLASFSVAIARAISNGAQPDCNCFGQLHSAPAGRGALARNLGLAAVAGLIFVAGPGETLAEALGGLSGAELALAGAATVVAAVLAVQAWFSWQLFRQQGRLVERVRALEQRVVGREGQEASDAGGPLGVGTPNGGAGDPTGRSPGVSREARRRQPLDDPAGRGE